MHYHHLVIFCECAHCSAQLKKIYLKKPLWLILVFTASIHWVPINSTKAGIQSQWEQNTLSSHSIQNLAYGFEWDHNKYRNKPLPLLLPPLSRIIRKVPLCNEFAIGRLWNKISTIQDKNFGINQNQN